MPTEFGLIGMLSIFIGIGSSLIDSGLTSSLIRTSKPDQSDYSTVFFINIFGSFFVYILIFIFSPYIASFYNQNILDKIIKVYSLTFIINAFAGVQYTKLTKEMNFKLQMIIQIPSIVLSGILGIILAFLNYGVWSLVYMNLFQALFSTIQLWVYSKWRPSFIFDKEKLKHHFNFGYKLTLSGILDTVYNNAYNVIIGKFFSVVQLGYYTRAISLQQLPIHNISSALGKVTYPLFASIKDDNIKLRMAYSKLMQQVVFWITPVMTMMIILAHPLFLLLLGNKWIEAVPYFQILCLAGILYPVHSYNLNILNVKGRSDLFLKLEIIKKIYITIGIACAIPFGIYGLLIFQVISSVLGLIINSWYSGKLIDYPLRRQIADIMPYIYLSFIVGGITYLFDITFFQSYLINHAIRIIVVFFFYLSLYLGLSYILKFRSLKDFTILLIKR